jgi:5-methylcytosine-specific restriction endonuclease McrA
MHIPKDKRLEDWIRELYKNNEIVKFYKSIEWRELRAKILERSHNECQRCIEHGKYTRAITVHHINEVRNRPDLALSEYYIDCKGKRQRNLIALCHTCHDIEHQRFKGQEQKKQLNEERW